MKFKAKLCTKFLTDTEPTGEFGQSGQSGSKVDERISTNIKIYSRVRTKPVSKIRKERRKKFETEDEED